MVSLWPTDVEMEKLFITSVQSVLVFLRLISDRLQEQTCEKTMLRVCMQSSPASVLSSQTVNTASTHKYVLGSWLNGIHLLICLHFAATQTAKALLLRCFSSDSLYKRMSLTEKKTPDSPVLYYTLQGNTEQTTLSQVLYKGENLTW